MLDKSEFYHGAALVRLMENPHCKSVRKRSSLYYIVNEEILVFIKYTTKARSPWHFSFDHDDLFLLKEESKSWKRTVIALVCGGDGVCTVTLDQCDMLLGGKTGWISARRNFNERYAVNGIAGELRRKIPVSLWPEIAFSE